MRHPRKLQRVQPFYHMEVITVCGEGSSWSRLVEKPALVPGSFLRKSRMYTTYRVSTGPANNENHPYISFTFNNGVSWSFSNLHRALLSCLTYL